MIRELRIRNLAIIEDVRLEFSPGLNILTGETGAGKSIILGALKLILGERAAAEDVRTGEEFAEAEALVDGPLPSKVMQWLAEVGIPAEEDGIVLRREISTAGKSKAIINGRLAPAHQLKALGDLLVDLHGQHQHQSLLDADNHLGALDAFADTDDELADVAAQYGAWSQAKAMLHRLQGDERSLEREKSTLEYQIREIEQAQLRAGEEEELLSERMRLRNSEQLREAAVKAYALLQDSQTDAPSAMELIGAAEGEVAELARLDESQSALLEQMTELRIRLDELAQGIQDYGEALEADPKRLQQVEDRLDVIRNLKRKYGASIQEILQEAESYRERYNSLTNRTEELERLASEVSAAEGALAQACETLSEKRKKAALVFEKKIEQELNELQMGRAKFKVNFEYDFAGAEQGIAYGEQRVVVTAAGVDRVEFLLSTNPGEALKPLRKIASGGELSRIMLAMKSILAQRDAIPTLVFDEIDTGISGATAQVVGEKMKKLAQSHQVICITHLPQIAARAYRHIAVQKVPHGKRMTTRVSVLAKEQRVAELARLMGGESSSAAARKHAEELIQRHEKSVAS